jgi:superfamily II DNA/RNA helicase
VTPDPLAHHVPQKVTRKLNVTEPTEPTELEPATPSAEPTDLSAVSDTPPELDAAPLANDDDGDEAIVVPELPPRATFDDLGLSEAILRAVHEMDYLHPTPIQEMAIPSVLMGRDVLGCAQTGTGKTASFVLPMMDILSGSRARARMPRSLILEPTRELALQVSENFVLYGKYLKLNHVLIIGGESMSDQKDALMRGVDVLIATPGRLIDLIERGGILLSDTKLLVIDEADRMLDMGFIPDVERIVGLLPRGRQTLFFSATMAPPIRKLADAFLDNPKEITVSRPASVATTITQGLVLVEDSEKRDALRRLLQTEDVQNALIFCNRKRDVDILAKSLLQNGFSAGALHGDMTQPMRFATLERFKAGEIKLLVCSDVAARGLDIGGLSHVFNYDVPIHAEDYVHRIGRTGRAERTGHAFTIATPDDRIFVDAIETLTGMPIPRMAIAGMATAHWSEDGGKSRGRGGRGRPSAAAKPAPGSSDRGSRGRAGCGHAGAASAIAAAPAERQGSCRAAGASGRRAARGAPPGRGSGAARHRLRRGGAGVHADPPARGWVRGRASGSRLRLPRRRSAMRQCSPPVRISCPAAAASMCRPRMIGYRRR